MSVKYLHQNLLSDLPEVEADTIVSRTIYNDDQMKAVLFSFAPGQELSEHTASMPAVIHILRGEARLTLDGDTLEVGEGAWVHMPAQLPHSLYAKAPVVMLLSLLKTV
ncbi:MAG TPA: cupin domain-containing protein [Anaerolineales bacterium]|nr:cupin domain-containing protein [Anaerolineales bacterium]